MPKAANDMMDVGRLQKFEGKITAQGKLLLHGPLLCTEYPSGAGALDRQAAAALKPRDLQVFLFEQNIIFSEIVGKKTQFTNPSYIYKSHVQVGGLGNFAFVLVSVMPSSASDAVTYVDRSLLRR